ncbi:MAG: PA0069 family radical SAM protein [Pseudomonadota bacterium]
MSTEDQRTPAPAPDSRPVRPAAPIKGLGAQSAPAPRYLPLVSELDEAAEHEALAANRVRVTVETARTIITRNRSPDIPFDRSINPYRGCEHGCIYCFARPTHAYLDLSPGVDFERELYAKTNAAERLETALSTPGYAVAPIAIGTHTDPYQPLEGEQQIMRQLLEVLLAHRHPVSIVTKGALVLRDLDLLSALAELGLVKVMVSLTTLDTTLKARLEPRTAAPQKRLRILRELSAAGVPTGAMLAPIIPFINDAELEAMVEAAAASGARALNYILLRLPLEVAPLFSEWLTVHFPDRAERVLNAVRDTRGGALYRSRWGERMRGTGPVAALIGQRFRTAARKAGLQEDLLPRLRTDLFQPPEPRHRARRTAESRQGDLFDS